MPGDERVDGAALDEVSELTPSGPRPAQVVRGDVVVDDDGGLGEAADCAKLLASVDLPFDAKAGELRVAAYPCIDEDTPGHIRTLGMKT